MVMNLKNVRMKTNLKRPRIGARKFWLVLWILSVPGYIGAQSLNARFTTSLYSWERHLTESESDVHFRFYQTAQLTLGQLANNKLSVHFYGQRSRDIGEDSDDDGISRIYNAYLQWRERKGVLERIKLGRHRIYSGVAYGTIDGADVSLRVGKWFKVGGFAGILVPATNDVEVEDWDDSHALGLRASTNKLWGTKVLISYMQRNRRPVAYSEPGRYTERVITFESLETRLVGIDAYRAFSRKLNAYGRLDYDLEQERVRRGQLELELAPSQKFKLTAEFMHRAPLVAANSIFWVFDHSTTQNVGLRGSYQFKAHWFVTGNFGAVFYDGDESVRFGLGLRCRYGSLGYNFRSGYAGQNNGIYAALNYPLTRKIGLLVSSGFSRYSLFDENAATQTSFTGSAGINYRPSRTFSFDFLAQGVNNRFYDSDFRFFAKANYWFFARF